MDWVQRAMHDLYFPADFQTKEEEIKVTFKDFSSEHEDSKTTTLGKKPDKNKDFLKLLTFFIYAPQ